MCETQRVHTPLGWHFCLCAKPKRTKRKLRIKQMNGMFLQLCASVTISLQNTYGNRSTKRQSSQSKINYRGKIARRNIHRDLITFSMFVAMSLLLKPEKRRFFSLFLHKTVRSVHAEIDISNGIFN